MLKYFRRRYDWDVPNQLGSDEITQCHALKCFAKIVHLLKLEFTMGLGDLLHDITFRTKSAWPLLLKIANSDRWCKREIPSSFEQFDNFAELLTNYDSNNTIHQHFVDFLDLSHIS